MPIALSASFSTDSAAISLGGAALESSLGKPLPPGDDWAESWEIADHGADQSIVEFGPLAGTTLRELVSVHGRELLGRHHPQPRFPLLLKFLDAAKTLSVQVHPDDARAARLDPPDAGKTEAWVVVEAQPGSMIYAGLKPGVDRDRLAAAIREGTCQDCLHVLRGLAGRLHLRARRHGSRPGAGLLVAEIQQSSDVTYRLFDWNRLGPDGRPRPLHVEQGLDGRRFRPRAGHAATSAGDRPAASEPAGRVRQVRLGPLGFRFAAVGRRRRPLPHSRGIAGRRADRRRPGGSALPRGGTALLPARWDR